MAVLPVGISGEEPTGYQIERSLRFNSADTAYIVRQNGGTAGNRKVWTLSFWMKPSVISTVGTPGDGPHLFMVGNTNPNGGGGPSTYSRFLLTGPSNNLVWGSNNSSGEAFTSTNVFRDLSAWYHVVVSFDATNTIIRCYVNNQEIAYTSRTNPTNTNSAINAANYYNSFGIFHTGDVRGWNGYLTEFNFIDGSALDPTSFGEFNSTTGVWQPKAYTGSYGTNGFYLNFADNSSVAALGYDAAGSNDWSVNGISVTAGVNNDSLVDTPTNYGTDTGVGGEVRGNYCTLNPLDKGTSTVTLTNGNLNWSSGAPTYNQVCRSTISVTSGKWYWEVTPLTNGAWANMGVCDALGTLANASRTQPGGWVYQGTTGNKMNNNSSVAYGSTYTNNDVIGVALDMDGDTLTFYKNGVSQGVAYSSGFAGKTISALMQDGANDATATINFGQRPFSYAAPTGFKALCTQNLDATQVATIPNGGDYFNAVKYPGLGSSQGITGVGFQPDLVWIKETNAAADHALYDSVRGVENQLESNTTTDETTESTGLTAFDADGFTVGSLAQVNTSTDTYIAWCWKKGATPGFDIVTYTGNGTARTISHNLAAVPNMIIVKARTTASTDVGWPVYHSANTTAPETDYLMLNTTADTADLNTIWDDTAPTSSVFSVGTNALVNANNDTYVAYLFSAIPGYSAFGSYTGNGSADGPFVFLGFRPAFVMVKRTDSTGSWIIHDASRNIYNPTSKDLYANLSDAETTASGTDRYDFLANGFKLKVTTTNVNASGGTYIYMAFAENPFKYSLAR